MPYYLNENDGNDEYTLPIFMARRGGPDPHRLTPANGLAVRPNSQLVHTADFNARSLR